MAHTGSISNPVIFRSIFVLQCHLWYCWLQVQPAVVNHKALLLCHCLMLMDGNESKVGCKLLIECLVFQVVTYYPFSLFPTPVPKAAFLQALAVQTHFNTLVDKISQDPDFLEEALARYKGSVSGSVGDLIMLYFTTLKYDKIQFRITDVYCLMICLLHVTVLSRQMISLLSCLTYTDTCSRKVGHR